MFTKNLDFEIFLMDLEGHLGFKYLNRWSKSWDIIDQIKSQSVAACIIAYKFKSTCYMNLMNF